MLGRSRKTVQRGRLLWSAAVADQQDGDGDEHRVTISVEAVVAADVGKSFRGAVAYAGKSVKGAAAAEDTTGAGVEEPVHVAPAAAITVGQRAP